MPAVREGHDLENGIRLAVPAHAQYDALVVPVHCFAFAFALPGRALFFRFGATIPPDSSSETKQR